MSPFKRLYDGIAERKGEAFQTAQYAGGNGRIDRAAELIRSWNIPRDASLLDIGGATGNLGYSLRDLFTSRYVIDIAEACGTPAEIKGNSFICGNVDDGIPFGSSQVFDVVVMLDVIEHVLDPQGLAVECFRVMKPGGYLLVNTPNIQFWRHLESLVVDGVFPHTSGDREVYHGGHVAFFNMHDMQSIFGTAGFLEMTMHFEGLSLEPPPPMWKALSRVPQIQMSVADLVVSARKPS